MPHHGSAYNNQSNSHTIPGSEQWGLVNFAFHPDFAQNGWVFLLINGRGASDAQSTSRVIRYTLADDRRFDPASGLVIIDQLQTNSWAHHFGHLVFGPGNLGLVHELSLGTGGCGLMV